MPCIIFFDATFRDLDNPILVYFLYIPIFPYSLSPPYYVSPQPGGDVLFWFRCRLRHRLCDSLSTR